MRYELRECECCVADWISALVNQQGRLAQYIRRIHGSVPTCQARISGPLFSTLAWEGATIPVCRRSLSALWEWLHAHDGGVPLPVRHLAAWTAKCFLAALPARTRLRRRPISRIP